MPKGLVAPWMPARQKLARLLMADTAEKVRRCGPGDPSIDPLGPPFFQPSARNCGSYVKTRTG